MGKMAYDPQRIDLLRSSMRSVTDLLDAMSCDDSAADGAMGTVRLARSSLGSTCCLCSTGFAAARR